MGEKAGGVVAGVGGGGGKRPRTCLMPNTGPAPTWYTSVRFSGLADPASADTVALSGRLPLRSALPPASAAAPALAQAATGGAAAASSPTFGAGRLLSPLLSVAPAPPPRGKNTRSSAIR